MFADNASYLNIRTRKQLKSYLYPETKCIWRATRSHNDIIYRTSEMIRTWKPGTGKNIFLIQTEDDGVRISATYLVCSRLISEGYRVVTLPQTQRDMRYDPPTDGKTVLLLNTAKRGREVLGNLDAHRRLLNQIRTGKCDSKWKEVPILAMSDARARGPKSQPPESSDGIEEKHRKNPAPLFAMGFIAMAVPLLLEAFSALSLLKIMAAVLHLQYLDSLNPEMSSLLSFLFSSIPGAIGIIMVLMARRAISRDKYRAFFTGAMLWFIGSIVSPFVISYFLAARYGDHVSVLTSLVGFLLVPQILAYASYPVLAGPFVKRRVRKGLTLVAFLYILFDGIGIYALLVSKALLPVTSGSATLFAVRVSATINPYILPILLLVISGVLVSIAVRYPSGRGKFPAAW